VLGGFLMGPALAELERGGGQDEGAVRAALAGSSEVRQQVNALVVPGGAKKNMLT
jgi:hypothetical protein